MREIYHAATEVRIWLGPRSENGTRCLQFIQSLTRATASIWDPSEIEDDAIEEAAMQVIQLLLVDWYVESLAPANIHSNRRHYRTSSMR
jgi:hypothetical protein